MNLFNPVKEVNVCENIENLGSESYRNGNTSSQLINGNIFATDEEVDNFLKEEDVVSL